MPGFGPSGIVHTIERRVRRLRRRRNFYELQRGLYLVVAVAGGVATALLLYALFAPARRFMLATAASGATLLAASALISHLTRRRWVGSREAAGWIDRRGACEGRLVTLVELCRRVARSGEGFFLPLLLEENVARLPRWDPRRLVPHAVPRGALAAALAATIGLLVTIVVAPRLQPATPEILSTDVPVRAGGRARLDAIPGRLLLAPTRERLSDRPAQALVPADRQGDEASRLTRWSAAIQERIRSGLWGEAWQKTREAMARAEREQQGRKGADAAAAQRGERDDGFEDERWEIARSSPSDRLADRREATTPAGAVKQSDAADDARAGTRAARAASGSGGGEPAAGAGTATDPNLFGPASGARYRRDRFELAIAARVHGLGGEPGPPSGEAPAADADAGPALGARQRRDAPVHKMAVPPAYEAIVRGVFAHRTHGEAARP